MPALYHPPQKTLEKYADVLVNFALGGGQGVKKGETVYLICSEYAKPLYVELRRAILKAGGHLISDYRPADDKEFKISREFFVLADDHQIDFFPHKYMRGLVDQMDHMIYIDCDTDKQALQGIDPKKIMRRSSVFKPYLDWRREKENKGKFSWTIALYGTPAQAKEAGLSLEDYWRQIISACWLDEKDPIKKWRDVFGQIKEYQTKLNALPIDRLHVTGPAADLWIKLGEKRRWRGGGGANIPSFEIFTSPDWRGTEGWIKFNQPLYRYGNLIEGIELEFKKGKVVKMRAKKNERVLKEMIVMPNADKIGEFSLTDSRFSRITKFMAETLFDENMGGPEGNTHIAVGDSYHDCYAGNPAKLKKADWQRLGFNDSSVHTDIISTDPRTVTAVLKNGTEKIIYDKGKFVL